MRVMLTLGTAAVLAAGCSEYSDPAGPPLPPGPPPTLATVNVEDNQFVAPTVRVAEGGTVRWTWRGATLHNVTFNGGGPASATQIAGTYEQAFPAAGNFPYLCTVHGQAMSGTIQVVPAQLAKERTANIR